MNYKAVKCKSRLTLNLYRLILKDSQICLQPICTGKIVLLSFNKWKEIMKLTVCLCRLFLHRMKVPPCLTVVVNNLERVGCGDAHWVREGVDFWFYEQIAKSCLSSYYIQYIYYYIYVVMNELKILLWMTISKGLWVFQSVVSALMSGLLIINWHIPLTDTTLPIILWNWVFPYYRLDIN